MRSPAIALLALCLARAASAGSTDASGDLEGVRRQVRELEARLHALEQRQAQAGQERERAETALALAELRVHEGEAELDGLAKAEGEAGRAVTAAQERLDAAVAVLRLQLGVLAAVGRSGLAPLLLYTLRIDKELPRRVTVALAVLGEHKRRRDEVVLLLEQRAAARAQLSRRRAEKSMAAQQLLQRRRELEAARARAVAELARLEGERRVGAVALAAAWQAQERLERLWGSVMAGSRERLPDVRLVRGGLPWPVGEGKVVRGFGTQRDPRYGTTTVWHGLEFTVPAGAPVHAVAAGRVAFAQFFRGYGNLVILQHGAEVYSLYAQLATMFARVDQRVAIGEALGLVARDEAGRGNFYLEIRVGDRPQDPLAWLKPAGR